MSIGQAAQDLGEELGRFMPAMTVRSRRSARDGLLFAVSDLVVLSFCLLLGGTALAFYNAHKLQNGIYGWLAGNPDYLRVIVLFFVFCLGVVIASRRLGHYNRRRPLWQEIGDLILIASTAGVLHMAVAYLNKYDFSRLWLLTTWTAVAVALPLSRYLIKKVLIARGGWVRPTVVIGSGPNAQDAALALMSDPMLGYRIDAFYVPPADDGDAPALIEVGDRRWPVHTLSDARGLLPVHLGRPHVVVALEMNEMARHGELIEKLNLYYGDLDLISPLRGLPLQGAKITHFFGHDILSMRLYNNLSRPWPQVAKRAFDVLAGGLLLLLVSPVILLIALKLRREGGPVFFSHDRIGLGGRVFPCHKFRSMVPNAAEVLADLLANDPEARAEWETDRKLRNDPRITSFGDLLRRTSLDELPQLWNVVKGEMSLVGPRPVTRIELDRYAGDVVYYVETRPGMTGLWQISGRNDVDYRRRVHLDAWYVKNWNLWYDIVILVQTLRVVLRGRGAY